MTYDGSMVHFTFGIPRGADGLNGVNGTPGAPGADGSPGPPGEVSNVALAAAIAGTSNNSNGVTTLGASASLAYDQTQMQEVINKIDELINALRR